VLVFVGMKMLAIDFYKVPIGISLGIIAVVLGVSIAASWLWPRTAATDQSERSLTENTEEHGTEPAEITRR
jgi:tellurite resistance protein TerC